MLVVMDTNASDKQIEAVCTAIRDMGYQPYPMPGAQRTAVCITGNKGPVGRELLAQLDGVREIIAVSKPYKLVSRETRDERTVVDVRGEPIGGDTLTLIAGPCSVESEDRTMLIAERLCAMDIKFFRAGAYKPRTSPYSFQGLEKEGLTILAKVREQLGLRIVTEVLSEETVEAVAEVADVLQIGARNMQNTALLKRVARCGMPVLLKRSPAATLEELLMAGEYLVSGGSPNVVFCERGIRAFGDHARNILDVSAIAAVREMSHLPIMGDPSHAAGKRTMVPPLARAALAAGADGLMIEVHTDPTTAWSDGAQTLYFEQFETLAKELREYHRIFRRSAVDVSTA